jgi:hypothetical protein
VVNRAATVDDADENIDLSLIILMPIITMTKKEAVIEKGAFNDSLF